MPKILFASNNIVHFPNSEAGSNPDSFDATRVPYSIMTRNNETITSPLFFPNTVGNESWIHFRTYFTDVGFGAGGEVPNLLSAYDINDNLLFTVKKRSGSNSALLDLVIIDGAGTSVTAPTTITPTRSKQNSLDFRYYVDGLGMQLDCYVNSALAGTVNMNANPNNFSQPARFTLGPSIPAEFSKLQFFSEIIVANADTRNARLNLLRPATAGTYEDWLGPLASLADNDPTTGMTTIAANQRTSMTLTPYNGAANISNFVAVSTTTRGQNSPSKIKHMIRMGGVDYDSAEYPIGFPLQYTITDYGINPATSLPWVSSDLIGLESGIVSVA